MVGLQLVSAFPSGSPRCGVIKPKHKGAKPQTSESPYKLQTSAVKRSADGKATLNVSLGSGNDTKFKGFILYATAPGSDAKIGSFTKTSGTNTLSCEGDAVSSCFLIISFLILS